MTFPTSRSTITCLVPAPRRLTSWLLPFEPFQMSLWLCIFACLIIESLGLLITRRLEKAESEEHSWLNSLQFGCISSLKLFISQGTDYVVNSSSVRTVLFSCYMVDIILTSIYCSGLASILTIPSLEEAPDTIDRMIKQKLLWAGNSDDWKLTMSGTEDARMLQIVSLYRTYSPEELRAKSLTERIGFVVERSQFGSFALPTYIQQPALNRFKIMIEDFSYQHCVAYMPRAWSLLERFNNFCIMMQSSGIMKHWELEVVAKHLDGNIQKQIQASAHANFEENGPIQLGVKNFAGIITLWIGGTIISILTFFGEISLHRWKQANVLC